MEFISSQGEGGGPRNGQATVHLITTQSPVPNLFCVITLRGEGQLVEIQEEVGLPGGNGLALAFFIIVNNTSNSITHVIAPSEDPWGTPVAAV